MNSKEMKFKDFKKVVLAYFSSNGRLKRKYTKSFIKIENCKKEPGKPYKATFKYAGRKLKLERIGDYWYLFIEGWEKTFIKNGTTINECCDCLWENKTPESIQKNWYF